MENIRNRENIRVLSNWSEFAQGLVDLYKNSTKSVAKIQAELTVHIYHTNLVLEGREVDGYVSLVEWLNFITTDEDVTVGKMLDFISKAAYNYPLGE